MRGFEPDERELARNTNPRCVVVLTLDVSGSMTGQPIDELNRGVKLFCDYMQTDEEARYRVEPAIVTFSSGARVVTPISPVDEFLPPTLQAGGETDLGEGLHLAVDTIQERRSLYKQMGISTYVPWLVLITDGQPTDDWRGAAQKARDLEARGKLLFYGIGVGDLVDMDTLEMICPPNRKPALLRGLNYNKFFEWLSDSLSRISCSKPGDEVHLKPIDGWSRVRAT